MKPKPSNLNQNKILHSNVRLSMGDSFHSGHLSLWCQCTNRWIQHCTWFSWKSHWLFWKSDCWLCHIFHKNKMLEYFWKDKHQCAYENSTAICWVISVSSLPSEFFKSCPKYFSLLLNFRGRVANVSEEWSIYSSSAAFTTYHAGAPKPLTTILLGYTVPQ